MAVDNWLHLTVLSEIHRYYGDPYLPIRNDSASGDDPNSPSFQYAAGYAPLQECDAFINRTSPDGTLPCSLDASPSFFNLKNPSYAYLTLVTGISSVISGNFSNTNFDDAFRSQSANAVSGDQVITYHDHISNLSHSLLFWLDGAAQSSDGSMLNHGYDYVAPTHSMQTMCVAADQPCHLNEGSTLYDCSSSFSGNLSQEPTDGRVRIPGWNTTFYKIDNGVPKEIKTFEDQNPFSFNVTVQLDGFSDVLQAGFSPPPPLIQTDDGSVAFALTCSTTVYNINYTLIDGVIRDFVPKKASDRLASIVRAPLQVYVGYLHPLVPVLTLILGGTVDTICMKLLSLPLPKLYPTKQGTQQI